MEDEEMAMPDINSVEQAYNDETQELGEYQQDISEEQQFGANPSSHQRESIFTFFRHILGLKNSSKVANLDKRELGMIDLSVRNCEYLSGVGYILHNKSYGDFFRNKSEIVLSTSMAKRGWLSELVVSQKKFSQRMVQPVSSPQQPKKGFLGFGGNKPQQPADGPLQ